MIRALPPSYAASAFLIYEIIGMPKINSVFIKINTLKNFKLLFNYLPNNILQHNKILCWRFMVITSA